MTARSIAQKRQQARPSRKIAQSFRVPPDQLVFTPEEVRQILKIGVNQMGKLLLSGELASVKITESGRLRRITRQALEDYLTRRTTNAA